MYIGAEEGGLKRKVIWLSYLHLAHIWLIPRVLHISLVGMQYWLHSAPSKVKESFTPDFDGSRVRPALGALKMPSS